MMCSGSSAETFGFNLPEGVAWQDVYLQAGGILKGCRCADRIPSFLLLLGRAVLLATWSSTVAWSLHDWGKSYPHTYWFIKFTHWGATIEFVYFSCLLFTTIMAMCSRHRQSLDAGTPEFVKVTWFLGSLMPAVTIFITVFYWAFANPELQVIQFAMHGLNYLLVLTDLLFTSQPFYLKHVWTSMLVGVSYALFSYVYYVAGGLHPNMMSMYIYMRLDWNEGLVTFVLFVVAISIAGPAAHAMNWMILHSATRSRIPTSEGKGSDFKVDSVIVATDSQKEKDLERQEADAGGAVVLDSEAVTHL
mmetsp:Transcript_68387/g.164137  ORF Transcript_68387/g.164137 Transcript_68387/m.164137 type:complete len:304 (-) Transcript_68387:254-1165(-)